MRLASALQHSKWSDFESSAQGRYWMAHSGYLFSVALNVDSRGAVLSSLPAPDLLATFIWLFPDAEVSAERRSLWRFNRAMLQANSGDIATARKGFQSLLGELKATGQLGRLLDETQRGLAQLGTGAAVKAEAVKKMAK